MNKNKYAAVVNRPQNVFEPIEGREKDMIKNADGAFVFAISKWSLALRWLILGAQGGTFYATKRELTKDNYNNIKDCLAEDGVRLVDLIRSVSLSGRAAHSAPAIFALAVCATKGDDATRRAALDEMPAVCRATTDFLASSMMSWY